MTVIRANGSQHIARLCGRGRRPSVLTATDGNGRGNQDGYCPLQIELTSCRDLLSAIVGTLPAAAIQNMNRAIMTRSAGRSVSHTGA